jgi:hypothetical protein
LLLEAARVFNAAGPDYRTVAAVVAERALKAIAKAEPDVHRAILGDAVALRLSDRVPGGYQASLELLKDIREVKEDDPEGRLHLLRALARGQMYLQERRAGKPASDAALDTLRRQIRQDLTFAFAQNPALKAENAGFWDAQRSPLPPKDRDLEAVYEDDPEFRALVCPKVPPGNQQPPAEQATTDPAAAHPTGPAVPMADHQPPAAQQATTDPAAAHPDDPQSPATEAER